MKINSVSLAFAAFVGGVILATVYPSNAEQTLQATGWKVTISRPDGKGDSVHIVRHNIETGQTMVLSCGGISGCGKKQKWLELPVDVIK
jgi:hypothetical protein